MTKSRNEDAIVTDELKQGDVATERQVDTAAPEASDDGQTVVEFDASLAEVIANFDIAMNKLESLHAIDTGGHIGNGAPQAAGDKARSVTSCEWAVRGLCFSLAQQTDGRKLYNGNWIDGSKARTDRAQKTFDDARRSHPDRLAPLTAEARLQLPLAQPAHLAFNYPLSTTLHNLFTPAARITYQPDQA